MAAVSGVMEVKCGIVPGVFVPLASHGLLSPAAATPSRRLMPSPIANKVGCGEVVLGDESVTGGKHDKQGGTALHALALGDGGEAHGPGGPKAVFRGYFKESVPESLCKEAWRLRFVVLRFFWADGTVQVLDPEEPHLRNDGMPHGVMLKRTNLHSIEPSTAGDVLRVGSTVEVYGKHIRLYACDAATRKLFATAGMPQPADFDPPVDAWLERQGLTSVLAALEGETAPAWHGVKMSPSTRYVEAVRGVPRATSEARALVYDALRLRFLLLHVSCEGTAIHRVRYWLTFHMASREVEIREEKGQKDYASFTTLLRRGRLPKSAGLVHDDRPRSCDLYDYENDYYNEDDLVVGGVVHVFGRDMVVCDCDDATQAWYTANRGVNQRAGVVDPTSVPAPAQPTPAWPPCTPHHPAALASTVTASPHTATATQPAPDPSCKELPLTYAAKLDVTHPIDSTRQFFIMLYDRTEEVSVYEVEVRNSGIAGGTFLRRSKLINPATATTFRPADFIVGATLTINYHRFTVVAPRMG